MILHRPKSDYASALEMQLIFDSYTLVLANRYASANVQPISVMSVGCLKYAPNCFILHSEFQLGIPADLFQMARFSMAGIWLPKFDRCTSTKRLTS